MNKESTTQDLTEFGYKGRNKLIELLKAWQEQGLPSGFIPENVSPMMNHISGHVFLINEDFQCAMMNGDMLEQWYYCGNCGHEGFEPDCRIRGETCNKCEVEE